MTIDEAQAGVAAARRGKDLIALADSLVGLASELVPAGQLAEARAALDDAAAIFQQALRSDDERHCRQLSATVSRWLADLNGARERATRAARLSPGGSPGAVSAAAELGEIGLAAGDAVAAAGAFGDALRHAQQVDLRPADRAGLYRKHAAALAAEGQAHEAVTALDSACDLLERAGDASNALRCQIEATTALQNAGEFAEAAARRTRALEKAQRHQDDHALADLELLEGAATLARRDLVTALVAVTRAREHALRANAPFSYIAAALAMAELYEESGDRLNAYATLATGYATVADLLGRDAAQDAFAPMLGKCRKRWGPQIFQQVKSEYEDSRRKTRLS